MEGLSLDFSASRVSMSVSIAVDTRGGRVMSKSLLTKGNLKDAQKRNSAMRDKVRRRIFKPGLP